MNPDPDFYADGGQRKPEPVATREQVAVHVARARELIAEALKRRDDPA